MIRAPKADPLTLDDLEAMAFKYGGTILRDLPSETYRLVGATMAGVSVTLGPVRGAS